MNLWVFPHSSCSHDKGRRSLRRLVDEEIRPKPNTQFTHMLQFVLSMILVDDTMPECYIRDSACTVKWTISNCACFAAVNSLFRICCEGRYKLWYAHLILLQSTVAQPDLA
jgi:hypothetical protein